MKNKRLTIGFIVPNLVGDYHILQWDCINAIAKKNDINLIIFSPFMYYSNKHYFNEYFKTYNLVDKSNVDGLIISGGSLKIFIDDETYTDFIHAIRNIPAVSIAQELEDIPSVLIDNKVGIKELVTHFIVEHQYKNIGFIRGPEKHQEAQLRFQAYMEALKEHDIPINNDVIFDGDFSIQSGKDAVRTLLANNSACDALIGANDDMIIGAYTELKKRNIPIPGRLALAGFDDIETAHKLNPPLTTVKQPFVLQMETAYDLLIDCINGKQVPLKTLLPSVAVIRASCGCKYTGEIPPGTKDPASNAGQSIYFTVEKGYYVGHLARISTTIINSLNLYDLYEQLKELVTYLTLPALIISLYKAGKPLHTKNTAVPPDTSTLFFVSENNTTLDIPESDTQFNTGELIPAYLKKSDDRRSYICSEILFQNNHFGFILFEYSIVDPLIYQLFLLQLSSSFQFIHIHSKLEKINKELIEKNKFKSKYLANMSHEIRTPLNSILGHIQFLQYKAFSAKDQLVDSNEIILQLLRDYKQKNRDAPVDALIDFCSDFERLIFNTDIEMSYYYYVKLVELFNALGDTHDLGAVHEELKTVMTILDDEVVNNADSVQSIRSGGDYLLELINSILDLSKIESGKIELKISNVKLMPFIETVMEQTKSYIIAKDKAEALTLVMKTSNLPTHWNFDSNKIKQVLLNLLSNAVKFTDKGTVSLELAGEAGFLVMSIKDTGIGIDGDEYKGLFKEFSRSKSAKSIEGTGLGLVLTRKLVELHGGTIELNKAYKEGAEFIVRLPDNIS